MFKREVGKTPKQYLLDCRMVEARKLLISTDFTLFEFPHFPRVTSVVGGLTSSWALRRNLLNKWCNPFARGVP